MPTRNKEFKIKLKKCKSLEDYRKLAEEYNIQDKLTPEDRERKFHRILRKYHELIKLIKIFASFSYFV